MAACQTPVPVPLWFVKSVPIYQGLYCWQTLNHSYPSYFLFTRLECLGLPSPHALQQFCPPAPHPPPPLPSPVDLSDTDHKAQSWEETHLLKVMGAMADTREQILPSQVRGFSSAPSGCGWFGAQLFGSLIHSFNKHFLRGGEEPTVPEQ